MKVKNVMKYTMVVSIAASITVITDKINEKAILHDHNHVPIERFINNNPRPAYTIVSSYSGSNINLNNLPFNTIQANL